MSTPALHGYVERTHQLNRLMVPCACEDYLIQMKLDLISCLQVVCCSHLMDYIPPNFDHSLHSVRHVLRNHT